MSIIGESLEIVANTKFVKLFAKEFINANVWDGEQCDCCPEKVEFTPNELQELIDDLIDHLYED